MAHSLYHARSSARQFGGVETDYLAIHQFFDQTKMCVAGNIHRLVLHNTFGLTLCTQAYGSTFSRPSDGMSLATETISLQHITEDFGFLPTLHACMHTHPLRSTERGPSVSQQAEVLEKLIRKFGGQRKDYEELVTWFYQPGTIMEDPRFVGMLGNTFGIFLAEQCFGRSFRRLSDQKEFPTRLVAEMLVYFALDTLPTLENFLKGMPLEAWVSRGARRLSEELADLS